MIKDSGERRTFDTGAVRDMAEGKGRFDIMPLLEIGEELEDEFLIHMALEHYETAFRTVADMFWVNRYEAMLDLAQHFENGLKKYGKDNWKKGIPVDSYIDSSVRHYCKAKAGWKDEPHERACLWNLICLIWTIRHHKPENLKEVPDCGDCEYWCEDKNSEWYLDCVLGSDKCEFKKKGE